MRALEAAKIKVVPTGLKHGTVTAIVDGRVFELTTLRRDVETDGRRAVVAFTDDWLEDAGRRDFTFNALYADRRRHAVRSVRRPRRSRRRPRALHRRCRPRASPRTACACCASSASMPGTAGRRSMGRASRPAARNAGALGALSGERVRKELLRTLEAPALARCASRRCAKRACSITGCPNMPASARLRALIAREDKADGLRRLAAILPAEADAVAIGKRLKLSTQEALRLEVMLARRAAIDIAAVHARGATDLPAGHDALHRPAPARGRCAGRLARSADAGAATGRRPSCR